MASKKAIAISSLYFYRKGAIFLFLHSRDDNFVALYPFIVGNSSPFDDEIGSWKLNMLVLWGIWSSYFKNITNILPKHWQVVQKITKQNQPIVKTTPNMANNVGQPL